LSGQARQFLRASGKLQALCYKEEIESALRTPGMAGFQLLDLHDFPGQGTALVGVLDPFWEEKGYVTAAEYHRFCGATVPLARLPKRVFTQDESASIALEVSHFGPAPLRQVWPVFKLVNDAGKTCLGGSVAVQDIEIGTAQTVTNLVISFQDLPAPARYRLIFGLGQSRDAQHPICENDWDLWVYPPSVPSEPQAQVQLVRDAAAAISALKTRGTVLWLLPPSQVAPDKKLGPVALGFSSIFWNTAWTRRQAPHTLGILCDPRQPLFAQFPTDAHSNWQWWYLVSRAGAMILNDLPSDLTPGVQVIDDWTTARKLGLLFEAKVAGGRLIVCSIDLDRDLDSNPVARQFRHSLLQYMASAHFRPKIEVTPEQLLGLVKGS
jgi:hypothetical protein